MENYTVNWIAVAVAALVPMVLGMIWYNKNTPMGKSWMKLSGMTEEKQKAANMPLMMILSLVFSFLLSVLISRLAIHQASIESLFLIPGQEVDAETARAILSKHKGLYRSFGHGMVHGFAFALCGVLPVLGMNYMYERRPWKLLWNHLGFWTICSMIMGGIISAWVP